jgi:hypothetical protein
LSSSLFDDDQPAFPIHRHTHWMPEPFHDERPRAIGRNPKERSRFRVRDKHRAAFVHRDTPKMTKAFRDNLYRCQGRHDRLRLTRRRGQEQGGQRQKRGDSDGDSLSSNHDRENSERM